MDKIGLNGFEVGGGPGMTTVLYIDSDQVYQRLLRNVLTARNIQVVLADDGPDGVRKARELQPDLIMIDLYLPRADSIEVLAELKGAPFTRNIPIICTSSRPANGDRRLARESGAGSFIAKPFQTGELIEVIQRNLSR
jgi:twitching motility two-component system response regulator PilH